MHVHSGQKFLHRRNLRHDLVAALRVGLHYFELFVGQSRRLFEDRIVDRDLPDIVEQRADPSVSSSSSSIPIRLPIATETRETRSECPRVYLSLPSIAAARALTVPTKISRFSSAALASLAMCSSTLSRHHIERFAERADLRHSVRVNAMSRNRRRRSFWRPRTNLRSGLVKLTAHYKTRSSMQTSRRPD